MSKQDDDSGIVLPFSAKDNMSRLVAVMANQVMASFRTLLSELIATSRGIETTVGKSAEAIANLGTAAQGALNKVSAENPVKELNKLRAAIIQITSAKGLNIDIEKIFDAAKLSEHLRAAFRRGGEWSVEDLKSLYESNLEPFFKILGEELGRQLEEGAEGASETLARVMRAAAAAVKTPSGLLTTVVEKDESGAEISNHLEVENKLLGESIRLLQLRKEERDKEVKDAAAASTKLAALEKEQERVEDLVRAAHVAKQAEARKLELEAIERNIKAEAELSLLETAHQERLRSGIESADRAAEAAHERALAREKEESEAELSAEMSTLNAISARRKELEEQREREENEAWSTKARQEKEEESIIARQTRQEITEHNQVVADSLATRKELTAAADQGAKLIDAAQKKQQSNEKELISLIKQRMSLLRRLEGPEAVRQQNFRGLIRGAQQDPESALYRIAEERAAINELTVRLNEMGKVATTAGKQIDTSMRDGATSTSKLGMATQLENDQVKALILKYQQLMGVTLDVAQVRNLVHTKQASNDRLEELALEKLVQRNQQMQRSVRQFANDVSQISSHIRMMGTIAVATIGGFLATTESLVQNMRLLSEETGMTLEESQKFIGALGAYGASAEQAERSLKIFAKTIDDAHKGVESAREKFNDLGITMAQLDAAGPSLTDKFSLLQTKIAGIIDPTKKAAEMTSFFGKGAVALIPAIAAGPAAFQAMQDKMEAVSNESAKSLIQLSQDINEVKNRFVVLAATTIRDLKPALEDLFGYVKSGIKWVESLSEATRLNIGTWTMWGGAILLVGSYIAPLIANIGRLFALVNSMAPLKAGEGVAKLGLSVGALASRLTLLIPIALVVGHAIAEMLDHWMVLAQFIPGLNEDMVDAKEVQTALLDIEIKRTRALQDLAAAQLKVGDTAKALQTSNLAVLSSAVSSSLTKWQDAQTARDLHEQDPTNNPLNPDVKYFKKIYEDNKKAYLDMLASMQRGDIRPLISSYRDFQQVLKEVNKEIQDRVDKGDKLTEKDVQHYRNTMLSVGSSMDITDASQLEGATRQIAQYQRTAEEETDKFRARIRHINAAADQKEIEEQLKHLKARERTDSSFTKEDFAVFENSYRDLLDLDLQNGSISKAQHDTMMRRFHDETLVEEQKFTKSLEKIDSDHWKTTLDNTKAALETEKEARLAALAVEKDTQMRSFDEKELDLSNKLAEGLGNQGDLERQLFELRQQRHDLNISLTEKDAQINRKHYADMIQTAKNAYADYSKDLANQLAQIAINTLPGGPWREGNTQLDAARANARHIREQMTEQAQNIHTGELNLFKSGADSDSRVAQENFNKRKEGFEKQVSSVKAFKEAMLQLDAIETKNSESTIAKAINSANEQIDAFKKTGEAALNAAEQMVGAGQKEQAIQEATTRIAKAETEVRKSLIKSIREAYETEFDKIFELLKELDGGTKESLQPLQDMIGNQLVQATREGNITEAAKLASEYKKIGDEISRIDKKTGTGDDFELGAIFGKKGKEGGSIFDTFMGGLGGGTSTDAFSKIRDKLSGALGGLRVQLTQIGSEIGALPITGSTDTLHNKFDALSVVTTNLTAKMDELARQFGLTGASSVPLPASLAHTTAIINASKANTSSEQPPSGGSFDLNPSPFKYYDQPMVGSKEVMYYNRPQTTAPPTDRAPEPHTQDTGTGGNKSGDVHIQTYIVNFKDVGITGSPAEKEAAKKFVRSSIARAIGSPTAMNSSNFLNTVTDESK